MIRKASALVLGLGLIASVALADEEQVSFPANYKTTFENYVSLDRVQNHDQIIRLFANDIAIEAAKEGRELPNGSVLVGEVYKAKKDQTARSQPAPSDAAYATSLQRLPSWRRAKAGATTSRTA